MHLSLMDQGLAVRWQCCQPSRRVERSNRCANRPADSGIPAILAQLQRDTGIGGSDVAVGDTLS
jgi:hypothetical protein